MRFTPLIVSLALTIPGSYPCFAGNTPEHNLPFQQDSIIESNAGLFPNLSSNETISLPLHFAGKLILLEAIIDSIPGYLIFDSGASGLVLNTSYFRDYHSISLPHASGITGSSMATRGIQVKDLQLSGLHFPDQKAHLADLSHVENQRNVKILGLINFHLFSSYEIILSLSESILQLNSNGQTQNNSSIAPFQSDCQLPFETEDGIIFFKASVGQKSLRFCLDTGAERNVINSRNPKSVMETITLTGKSNLRGASSSVREVVHGLMNDCSLGKYKLNQMETIIANLDPLNEVYGFYIDGMFGFPLLKQAAIKINFEKKEIEFCFRKEAEL